MLLTNFQHLKVLFIIFLISPLNSAIAQSESVNADSSKILGELKDSRSIPLRSSSVYLGLDDKVIILTRADSSAQSTISSLDLESLSEEWEKQYHTFDFFHLSEGISPSIVLSQIIGEGVTTVSAVDLSNGESLFYKEAFGGEIRPSPNGHFFYSIWTVLNWNDFIVFDRQGRELFAIPNLGIPWFSAAFNDSVVILIAGKRASFFEVPNGTLIKAIELPMIESRALVHTRVAAEGDNIVCFWYHSLIFINPLKEVRWSHSEPGLILNAAPSPNGEFVAVYSVANKLPKVGRLKLHETFSGEILWSIDIDIELSSLEGTTFYPTLSVSNETVKLMTPQIGYYSSGRVLPEAKTYLISFDKQNGIFKNQEVREGVSNVIQKNNKIYTLDISSANNVINVIEWRASGE